MNSENIKQEISIGLTLALEIKIQKEQFLSKYGYSGSDASIYSPCLDGNEDTYATI